MALADLTLGVAIGVRGRSFRAKIVGLSAGSVVAAEGPFGGFAAANGFLSHPSLDSGFNSAVVRVTERVAATGETKTTALPIEVLGRHEVRRQTEELGAFREPYAATQEDGSEKWFVRAVGAVDEAAGIELPVAVADLTASALSDTEVELDWTEAADAISHEYRIDGGSAVTASGPPMTVVGLDPDTEYDFEVRGVNGDGNGEWSNVATESTQAT